MPHAGYDFSGKCMAYLYDAISKQEIETFIILGTNHTGLGSKISLSIDDFDTPFGLVETDIHFIEQIIQNKENLDIKVDETPHKYEHSIEVQLPFIQVLFKEFKIVPILVRDLSLKNISKFSEIISKLTNDKTFILSSSDFTHYGAAYGFVPFKNNVKENLYKLDNADIDEILKLNVKGFLDKASESVCGKFPVACCLEICRKLNAVRGEKLCYYESGEISQDWENAVGYASIVFFNQKDRYKKK